MWDDLLVILGLLLAVVGLALLILPIVSTVLAVKANRRIRQILIRLDQFEVDQRALGARLERVRETRPEPAVKLPAEPAPPPEPAQPIEPEPAAVPLPGPEPEATAPAAALVGELPEPLRAQPPHPADMTARSAAGDPAVSAKIQSLEERIGLVWFTRIGALIGIVVAGWFFKYMVDNEWIGAWGRLAIGWLAGAGLLVWGQLLSTRRRKKVQPVFHQGILGLGLSVLLVASYASVGFYHLLPVWLAFGLVAVLCALGGTLSIVHRSEAILVLSLLAALANPVMLSTGVDRPWALFGYLLLMSGGALLVAVRMGYRFAAWFAVGGVAALFIGWYERFFDPSGPPAPGLYDQLPETLTGAYHRLADRLAPIVAAALFPLVWVLAGAGFTRRDRKTTGVALLLTAAVAAHAAYAALLFDHPLVLGGVLCALGAAFAGLLVRSGQTAWLGLPMLASFAVLASVSAQLEAGRLLPMMLLTGGLTAIYFGTVVRTALRQDWLRSARALLLTGGAGLGLALLAGGWMLPGHDALFGLLLAGLSAVYLWLALTAGSVALIVGAFLASALGMTTVGLQAVQLDQTRTALLLVAGTWFLIYVGFVCFDLFVRKAPWSIGRLFVLAGAGVGFGTLFLMFTPDSASILRALLSLGTGAVYLAVGLRMLRESDRGQDRALLPLGLALAFFSLAVALLLTGASITVTWAIEGAVLAWLAARARRSGQPGHPGWLIAALILFAVAALRLLSQDLPWQDSQFYLYTDSLGASGSLHPTAFGHPLAWALAGLGAALLFGAAQLARVSGRRFWRFASLAVVGCGHLCLLALLVGEARSLLTSLPAAIPAGLPPDEFYALLSAWQQAIADQSTRLDTVTTVVLGLYSLVLLGIGFGWRNRLHRLLGLSLFGLALAKLGLYDIWALPTLLKIVVGGSIAALLLAAAFLYGRFGDRIKSLLAEGDKLILLACLVAGTGLAGSSAQAADWPRYEWLGLIDGVQAPGDHRIEIEPGLYAASRSGLDDVRIAGPDGAEVPYLIRDLPQRKGWTGERVPARLLDPVRLADGTFRAVLDLGESVQPHNQVELQIDGHDYLRRTKVESSQDGRQWGLLAEGGFVFHVTGRCAVSQREQVFYPTTNARYLRISLLPGSDDNKLRIQAAHLARVQRPVLDSPERFVPLPLSGAPTSAERASLVQLERLPPGVPIRALILEVRAEQFVRRVEIEASTRRQAWFPVGSGVIHRVSHQGPGDPQPLLDESARIGLQSVERPWVRLRIEDGDDPPLEILAAQGVWEAEEIVFRAKVAGPHRLFVGRSDDRSPEYDLAALLQRASAAPIQFARLSPLAPNPDLFQASAATEPQPWSERHAFWIQIGIGALVGLLLIWTGLLVRRARRAAPAERDD